MENHSMTIPGTSVSITLDQLTRDLAYQYASGQLSHEEYLTSWEDLLRAFANAPSIPLNQ